MMRLLQISDTHFGTERPEVVGALGAAIRALRPEVILLCGDITQRARAAQFAAARRFLDAQPAAQRIVIPGNHDLPLFNLAARLLRPYAAFERAFGARETLWCQAGVCILALDATHPRRHKDGALSEAHLRERLAAARAACGGQGLLIVAAHQPLWTAWEMDRQQTLRSRGRIAGILAEARVDVMLSGHVHVPFAATSALCGLQPALPSGLQPAWCFVLSGSGTAVSRRTRAGVPNSFNLLSYATDEPSWLRLSRHDYSGGGFAPVESWVLQRAERGWRMAAPDPKPDEQA